jgi:hypothetical protein
MRYNTRSPSILITAILIILLLALSASPAFAEDSPPPEATPASEPTPPPEEPTVEDPPPAETPDEPVTDGEAVEETLPSEETTPVLEDTDTDTESVIPDPEASVVADPDPFYTFDGVTYRFSSGATYCADNYPGDPNCSEGLTTPFQDAITDLSGRGLPVDGSGAVTVNVEDGVYTETVNINGATWSSIPSLTIQSLNGSASTTVQGMTIQNMLDFFLQGFTITDGVLVSGNIGTISLGDIVASNTAGTGITVANHNGDVLLDSVQADNNAGTGASIDNTTGTGNVTITDSQFNGNNTTAAGGQQGGLEVTSNGTVTLQNVQASGNLDGDGASITADTIVVSGGSFNQNTSPLGGWGNGLAAQSTGGSIKVGGMTASNNEESGALLWYPASAADPANLITVENSSFKSNGQFGVWAQPESGTVILSCVCMSGNGLGDYMVPVGETVKLYPCPDKEDQDSGPKHKYVGILLSTEEPTIVNATNGVLVTFPPIQVIDPDELAIGKVWPRKKFELPAEIPENDTYMAGVEVQMINAEFIEGLEDGELKIEFFIPGYLVEREFSVLWWDVEAEAWVEIPFEFVPHPRLPGGKIVATWPETGTFILVLHPEPTE